MQVAEACCTILHKIHFAPSKAMQVAEAYCTILHSSECLLVPPWILGSFCSQVTDASSRSKLHQRSKDSGHLVKVMQVADVDYYSSSLYKSTQLSFGMIPYHVPGKSGETTR